jgi:hypothetical protein
LAAAALCGFWLVWRRRPAAQVQELKSFAHLAFAVGHRHPSFVQCSPITAPQKPALPGEAVPDPRVAQVGHQCSPFAVAHFRADTVCNGQRKSGARKQVGRCAQFDLRVDMLAYLFAICAEHRPFQGRKAARAEHCAKEQSVGPQRAPYLHQRAR